MSDVCIGVMAQLTKRLYNPTLRRRFIRDLLPTIEDEGWTYANIREVLLAEFEDLEDLSDRTIQRDLVWARSQKSNTPIVWDED